MVSAELTDVSSHLFPTRVARRGATRRGQELQLAWHCGHAIDITFRKIVLL